MRRPRVLSTLAATAALLVAGASGGASAAPASAAAAKTRPHYVTLGDSYSAGNGAGAYVEKTCWRSPNNYGQRVATRQGATHTTAACSGGVIDDILSPRELGSPTLRTRTYRVPVGAVDARAQWLRQAKADKLCGTPSQRDFSYTYSIRSSASAGSLFTATVRCQLVARPQIDSVTTSTDAVFVTIGGNDLGFTTIATQCMALRAAAGCKQAIDAANAEIGTLKSRTKTVLKAVHARSGGRAEVYLLGYPHLINTRSHKLSSTYDFGQELDRLQRRGDTAQRAAMLELDRSTTGRGGFTFVDVKPDWGGYTHGIDPRPLASQSNAWLVPIFGTGREFSEWVHPNAAGWGASALALYAAMR